MTESSPTRRGFFGHMAGAYLASGALTGAAVVISDPVAAMVAAYRDECTRLNAIKGDISEDEPMPVWDALGAEEFPVATTKEGAVEALRLAIEMGDENMRLDPMSNLLRSALGFFEKT